MIPLKEIDSAKYIAIVASAEELLPAASALYTHLLRLHKKVSFVYQTNVLDNRFSFLPWFDKVRNSVASSADLVVELDHKAFGLYDFFKTNKIEINKKMATALYASLLVEYDGFVSDDVNGMVFAKASELIVSGAEYRICNEFILKRTTLARLRLKSLMLKNMFLKNDAKEAVFYVCDADLKSTGATIKDATVIMKEALGLEYINSVSLVKSDENNKILKLDTLINCKLDSRSSLE